jgi:hypothetical protein
MKRSLGITLLELVLGATLGVCFLAAGSWAGAALGKGASSGWGDVIGALFGSVLAYPVGFICGMWLAALRLRAPHSVWKALVGAALGVAAVFLLAEPLRLNRDSHVLGMFLYLVPSILALVGFNLPRRGTDPAGGGTAS